MPIENEEEELRSRDRRRSDTQYERLKDQFHDLELKVKLMEERQANSIKEIDTHDGAIDAIKALTNEIKQAIRNFENFMIAQEVTNKTFAESIKKNTDFQNKFMIVGTTLLVLYQAFGTRLITLVTGGS